MIKGVSYGNAIVVMSWVRGGSRSSREKNFLCLHLASIHRTYLLQSYSSHLLRFERALVIFGCIAANARQPHPRAGDCFCRGRSHLSKAPTWVWLGFKPSVSWMPCLHVAEAPAFSFLKPRVSLSGGSLPERLSSPRTESSLGGDFVARGTRSPRRCLRAPSMDTDRAPEMLEEFRGCAVPAGSGFGV